MRLLIAVFAFLASFGVVVAAQTQGMTEAVGPDKGSAGGATNTSCTCQAPVRPPGKGAPVRVDHVPTQVTAYCIQNPPQAAGQGEGKSISTPPGASEPAKVDTNCKPLPTAESASPSHKIGLKYKGLELNLASPSMWLTASCVAAGIVGLVILLVGIAKENNEKSIGVSLIGVLLVLGLALGGFFLGQRDKSKEANEKDVEVTVSDSALFEKEVLKALDAQLRQDLLAAQRNQEESRRKFAEQSAELQICQARVSPSWFTTFAFAPLGLLLGMLFPGAIWRFTDHYRGTDHDKPSKYNKRTEDSDRGESNRSDWLYRRLDEILANRDAEFLERLIREMNTPEKK